MEIKDVEKLAELAKIDLSDTEKDSLLSDLGSILDYIKQIEEAPTKDDYEVPLGNVWREDEYVENIFSRDQIIGQFPDAQDDFLKVKKIL